MIASQAFLSHIAHRRLKNAKAELQRNDIAVPDESAFEEILGSVLEKHAYIFRPADIDQATAKAEIEQDTSEDGILRYLYRMIFEGGKAPQTKKSKLDLTKVVDDLASIGVDPSLTRTVKPECGSGLSQSSRDVLATFSMT